MATIDETSKSIQTFITALKSLSRQINNAGVNARLARKCREIVYRRVKSGKGVDSIKDLPDGTNEATLAPLSKSYIAARKGLLLFRTLKNGRVVAFGGLTLVERGKTTKGRGKAGVGARTEISFNNLSAMTLGEFGKPEKSNLTQTGAMLNDIVMSATEDGFALKIGSGRGRGRKKTNAELADILQAGASWTNGNGKTVTLPARPFFALTAGEVRILTRELENIIRERCEAISNNK